MDYTAKEIKRLMLLSYSKYQKGSITEAQAYRENTMLANILKAVTAAEEEAKLDSLRRTLEQTRDL